MSVTIINGLPPPPPPPSAGSPLPPQDRVFDRARGAFPSYRVKANGGNGQSGDIFFVYSPPNAVIAGVIEAAALQIRSCLTSSWNWRRRNLVQLCSQN